MADASHVGAVTEFYETHPINEQQIIDKLRAGLLWTFSGVVRTVASSPMSRRNNVRWKVAQAFKNVGS